MPDDNNAFSAPLDPRHQRRLVWAVVGIEKHLQDALARDRSEAARHLRESASCNAVAKLATLILERADPTANKRFTPWLVREYAEGRLLLEDLSTANETLTLFQRYAPRLKPEARDIQRYGSLAAAWEVVRCFAEREELRSNKAQRTLDRAKAYAESSIIHQDAEGFTVAVPLTEFAAKWWGRGTRWCTSAEHGNMFNFYHTKAPLFVITIPHVGKFQLWIGDGRIQFMDETDSPISDTVINAGCRFFLEIYLFLMMERVVRFPDLISVLFQRETFSASRDAEDRWLYSSHRLALAAVTCGARNLYALPERLRTEAVYIAAAKKDHWLLRDMPRHLQTASIVEASVRARGIDIWYVREDLRTPALCKLALQTAGHMLQVIPEANRTPELCEIAVRESAYALPHVPEELRTPELCLLALRHRSLAASLRWVPKQHLTELLYLEALRAVPHRLSEVPKHVLTEDMIVTALTSDPRLLARIPLKNRSPRVALTVLSSPNLSKWPDIRERRTSRFPSSSLHSDDDRLPVSPLQMFSAKHLDEELYCQALQTRHAYFELAFVPRSALTERLLILAAKHDPHSEIFGALPRRFQNEEFWKRLLKANGNLIWRLPKSLLCKEMCEIALQYGAERRMLPEEFREIDVPTVEETAPSAPTTPNTEAGAMPHQAVPPSGAANLQRLGTLSPQWSAFCERFSASLQEGLNVHLLNEQEKDANLAQTGRQPRLEARP